MDSDPFRSNRLTYRAVEEDDEGFISSLQQDQFGRAYSGLGLLKPAGKQSAKGHLTYLEKCMLATIICLPADEEDTEGKPVPIGFITMSHEFGPEHLHHRSGSIGIQIAKEHQSKGYGTEAIEWILNWGFMMAGLHRIGLGTPSYNAGAAKLYERIGFVPEGRRRDAMWFNGRFYDMLGFGMLRDEWEAKKTSS